MPTDSVDHILYLWSLFQSDYVIYWMDGQLCSSEIIKVTLIHVSAKDDNILAHLTQSLREKWPNTEFFLVCIFLY